MAQDGLVQVGGATYGFSSSGAMRVGWYLDSTGSTFAWRYFSSSGAMVKGWLSDGNNWYWLDDEGKMVHDSMLQIGELRMDSPLLAQCLSDGILMLPSGIIFPALAPGKGLALGWGPLVLA